MDVIGGVPGCRAPARTCGRTWQDERLRSRAYTREHGEDPPAVAGWAWPG